MHRTIDITVADNASDRLVADLSKVDGLIGLTLSRGASIVSPGDVVSVHVLNRAVDDVMRALAVSERFGPILVVTSENAIRAGTTSSSRSAARSAASSSRPPSDAS